MQGLVALSCLLLLHFKPVLSSQARETRKATAKHRSPHNGGVRGDEPSPRIVGGQDSKRGDAVHVAAMNAAGFVCSASIIDRRWVMSIYYCIAHTTDNLDAINIYMGMDDLDTDLPHAQFTKAAKIVYLNGTSFAPLDIVLIKTTDVLKVGSKFIGTGRLVTPDVLSEIKEKRRRCYVYNRGMGLSDDGRYVPNRQMKRLAVRYKPCKGVYEDTYPYNITALSCYKTIEPNTALCDWDDGTAFVCRHQGLWYLTGTLFLADPRDGCRARVGAVVDIDSYYQRIQDAIDNN